MARGDLNAALGFLKQALSEAPRSVDILNNCGGINGLLGRDKEALEFFEWALRVDPNSTEVLNNLGLTLGRLGRHAEAITRLQHAVRLRPSYFDALCNLGYSLNELRRYEEGLQGLEAALTINGIHVGALYNRGLALAGLGRHGLAFDSFKQVLAQDAAHLGAMVGAGASLLALERPDEALVWADRALRVNPAHAGALSTRGVALARLGCRGEALVSLEQAMARDPDRLDVLRVRGLLLLEEKHYEEALRCFQKALERDPGDVAALSLHARTLLALGRRQESLACMERVLELTPGDIPTLLSCGNVLCESQRLEEALECFDRVLAGEPDHFYAGLNRPVVLLRLHRLKPALQAIEEVIRTHPDSSEALNVRGSILWELNENEQARACVTRALALKPDYANALGNLAFMELADGDLRNGFLHFEARWKIGQLDVQAYRGVAPLWRGVESLAGKTILLYSEQGYGDTLQFARFAVLVARLGARVVLHVQPPLRELLAALPDVSAIISDGDPVPPHDFHCPLMSVPRAVGTTLDSIPGGVPYVQADPVRVEAWRRRLGPASRPRIGLVWAGRQYPPINIPRDIPLQQLLPLLTADVEFISLQKDVPEVDVALLTGLPEIKRFDEAFDSFAATAALVAVLDGVVAVDTAALHLAAAMGKRVWLMNRLASCWRWLRDGRHDSPWYPTLRIVRQPSLGDWESVVTEVTAALEGFIVEWRDSPPAASAALLPASADLMHRALILTRDGDVAGAIVCYTQVLQEDPAHTAALCALGVALGSNGYPAEALICFDKALALLPGNVDLLCQRGTALLALSWVEEALASFDQALEGEPGNVMACFYSGMALARLGRHREAQERFELALSLDPQHVARHQRSLMLLQLGRYSEGCRKRGSRWQISSVYEQSLASSAPVWLGERPAPGGVLLIQHEQTLADGVMLARFVAQAAGSWAKVLLAVPAALARLFAESFTALGNVEVLEPGAAPPEHSHCCPVMRLPFALRTEPDTEPREVPYLRAMPEQVDTWRARLGSTGRLRVGLVWRDWGAPPEPPFGPTPEELRAALDLSADFILLHDEVTDEDRAWQASIPNLCSCEEPLEDLADTAALINSLDLVLAPETAVAHVAAALGKPTWVLLSRRGNWRWLESCATSPWYPTARVFWQGQDGGWGAVVAEVRTALAALVAEKAPVPSATQLSQCYQGPDANALADQTAAGRGIEELLQAGNAFFQQHDYPAALERFTQALAAEPRNVAALMGCGRALGRQGRNEEALQRFAAVLDVRADYPDALDDCGVALHKLGRNGEALEYFAKALKLNAQHTGALTHQGFVLHGLERNEEALVSLDRAVQLAPRWVTAQHIRGMALERLGRYGEALTQFDSVVALDAGHVHGWCGRGVALERLGHSEEALASLDHALQLAPGNADVLYHRSFLLLAQGDLAAGFRGQTLLWTAMLPRPDCGSSAPIWLGHGSLKGKTVLLHHSQGFGDTIQFVRFVRHVAALGANILLSVPPPLARLMSTLPGGARIICGETPPPHDYHCPVVCLPAAMGTTLDTVPAPAVYLQADATEVGLWRERLGPARRPRIGLVWSGHPQFRLRAARDIPVAELEPLFQLPADLICLQKDVSAADREFLAARGRVMLFDELLNDFADTAALIHNLDLVFSVDTAAVHLAGALGKPVWILNRHAPCWRWLRGKTDSPWYPTARLFRQEVAGQWTPVVEEVLQAAQAWCSTWGSRSAAPCVDASARGTG